MVFMRHVTEEVVGRSCLMYRKQIDTYGRLVHILANMRPREGEGDSCLGC